MFSDIRRDRNFISGLIDLLELEYGRRATELQPAKRGFYGETWKAICADGAYFVKWIGYRRHMADYMRCPDVLMHMRRHGIDFIALPVFTRLGDGFCIYENGILEVQRFEEGEHTEDYPLDELFRLLVRCYRVPVDGLELYRESFDAHEYDQYVQILRDAESANLPGWGDMRAVLEEFGEKLNRYRKGLEIAMDRCAADTDGFVLTSGDVGGNVILKESGMFIIDWDHMVIAPPERDLWFYMQDMRQIDLIDGVFRAEGYPYRVRRERLMYYCYSRVFFYIREYIGAGLYRGEFDKPLVEMLRSNLLDTYFLAACERSASELW